MSTLVTSPTLENTILSPSNLTTQSSWLKSLLIILTWILPWSKRCMTDCRVLNWLMKSCKLLSQICTRDSISKRRWMTFLPGSYPSKIVSETFPTIQQVGSTNLIQSSSDSSLLASSTNSCILTGPSVIWIKCRAIVMLIWTLLDGPDPRSRSKNDLLRRLSSTNGSMTFRSTSRRSSDCKS